MYKRFRDQIVVIVGATGGLGTVLFAKLNAVWPRLADVLLLNRYGSILKRFL